MAQASRYSERFLLSNPLARKLSGSADTSEDSMNMSAAFQPTGLRAHTQGKADGAGNGIGRSGGRRSRRLGIISGGTFVPAAGPGATASAAHAAPTGAAATTKAAGAEGVRAYTGSPSKADESYSDPSQTVTLEDGNMAQLTMVVAAVQRGRAMVTNALAALGSSAARTTSALTANFHSSTPATIATVRSHLTAILSGLSGDITFEVESDGDARAYVYRIWSDIHLCPAWFADGDADNRARTVIHECSHKFKGTDDEAYHWQPAFATLSVSDALDNADSYAWFCMDVR